MAKGCRPSPYCHTTVDSRATSSRMIFLNVNSLLSSFDRLLPSVEKRHLPPLPGGQEEQPGEGAGGGRGTGGTGGTGGTS